MIFLQTFGATKETASHFAAMREIPAPGVQAVNRADLLIAVESGIEFIIIFLH